jgi:hypothetical protein
MEDFPKRKGTSEQGQSKAGPAGAIKSAQTALRCSMIFSAVKWGLFAVVCPSAGTIVGLLDDAIDALGTVAARNNVVTDPLPAIFINDAGFEGFDVNIALCGHA